MNSFPSGTGSGRSWGRSLPVTSAGPSPPALLPTELARCPTGRTTAQMARQNRLMGASGSPPEGCVIVAERRRGFTLVESLVVIAIIAVLIGLLLPAVQKVRESANRMKCQNNLKQIGLACLAYENSFGAFPRGNAATSTNFSNGDNRASWLFMALPYLEQGTLFQQVKTAGSLANAVAQKILPKALPFTRCPSDGFDLSNGNLCNYVGSS